MKRIVFLALFPVCALGQGYNLDFTIKGTKDSVAYLGYHFGDQNYVQDTAQIVNEHIHFEGPDHLIPGIYFLYSKNTFLEFLVDDQHFSIEADLPNLIQTMQIKNSQLNEDFAKLQRYNIGKQNEAKELKTKIDSTTTHEKAILQAKLDKINSEAEEFQDEIAGRHENDFLGKFLAALKKPVVPDSIGENSKDREFVRFSYYKKHFFDHLDLSDESLLRSPVYQSRVTEYLDKLTLQNPDSIIKSVDYILSKSQANEATFRYNLVTLSNKYEISNIMGFDKVFVHIIENYYLNGKATWADDTLLQKLKDRVAQVKPGLIGNQAPPLSLLDPSLQTIDLEQINSRFVVLYFYDPDCGHCKKKTPVLMSYYPQLKEKDVEIFAIDINTDIDKWKKFIETNKMDCLNGSDPYAHSNFRYEYDIRSTPTVYILDQNRKIVGKRIDVDDIPGFIDYLLKEN